MKFKIGKTRFSISFSFFALILLSCVWNDNRIFLISLVVSLIHELVHLAFMITLGARLPEIRFSVAGGEIVRGNDVLTNGKEAIISLSAPVFNIISGGVLLLLNPESLLGAVSLVIGVFNLLPYDTFDGGRGMRFLLQGRLKNTTISIITAILSFAVCFSFLAINALLIKNNSGNIFFLGMSLFLLILLVFRLFLKPKFQHGNL